MVAGLMVTESLPKPQERRIMACLNVLTDLGSIKNPKPQTLNRLLCNLLLRSSLRFRFKVQDFWLFFKAPDVLLHCLGVV